MAQSKKAAIIRVTAECLREILQLPPEAEIVRIDLDDTRGELRIVLHGAGWETAQGEKIKESPAATISDSWSAPRRTIDWKLGESKPETSAGPAISINVSACAPIAREQIRREFARIHGERSSKEYEITKDGKPLFACGGIAPGGTYIVGESAPELPLPSAVRSMAADLVRLPVRQMSPIAQDIESRRRYYRTMVQNGVMLPDEAIAAERAAEGLTRTATDNERPNGRT
jgi:hypothetical protein